MFIITNDNPTASEVVAAIYPQSEQGGVLVAEFESGRKLLRTKIPRERISWFLSQLPASRRLAVSSSAYHGKRILPNFRASSLVAVAIDQSESRCPSSTALYEKARAVLAAANCPLPSAVVATAKAAWVVWLVNRPYEFQELGELHTVESALALVLAPLGANPSALRSASLSLPLPQNDPSAGSLTAWATHGNLVSVDRDRLLRSTHGFVTRETADQLTMNCEVIEELGLLLWSRTLYIDQFPERYCDWMAGYAGSSCTFSSMQEIKGIARSVAESLCLDWNMSRDIRLAASPYSLADYVDILARSGQDGFARLKEAHYSVAKSNWPLLLADSLAVTVEEAYELGLRRIIPVSFSRQRKPAIQIISPMRIGAEDYVTLQEFLVAA